jgi:hypothetical protein
MKRITISMSDELYGDLLDYAADQSKKNVRRLSMGEAVRTLISIPLKELGYNRASFKAPQMNASTRQIRGWEK